jgi:hypothetical protein
VPFSDEHKALAQVAADPCIEALIASAELSSMSGFELCWRRPAGAIASLAFTPACSWQDAPER